jgi:hypothetical protein
MFGYSDVHHLSTQRQLEYFNEWSILISLYHFLCFTPFVSNPVVKYNVGYSLIAVVSINWLVNAFIMIKQTFLAVRFDIRTRIHRRKVKRILAKNKLIEAQNLLNK